jgi:hypothetical protein
MNQEAGTYLAIRETDYKTLNFMRSRNTLQATATQKRSGWCAKLTCLMRLEARRVVIS